jgi:ADP-ribosylglycohydrolase
MLGAIAGDMIGSVYENAPIKSEDFPLWHPHARATDDSVLAIAVAEAAMGDGDYARALRRWGLRYPHAGFGAGFAAWLRSPDPAPYDSYGNGAAMRVPALGWLFDSEAAVLEAARASAMPTHSHLDGIAGAQAVSLAVFLARRGIAREDLRTRLTLSFGYKLDRRLVDIRPGYRFDATCPGSVPEAFIAFFDSEDFEDTVRKAISLGGDADTQACIAGAIAEAYYGGVPRGIAAETRARLPADMAKVLANFEQKRFWE